MSKFDTYKQEVLSGAQTLLGTTLARGRKEAGAIFATHMANSEDRLKRWTVLLHDQAITEREFRLLIDNQITLGRMRLRTVKVIGKKAALEFRDQLRNLFVDKAVDIFLR